MGSNLRDKRKILVITIHGTWASKEDEVGDAWWQRTGILETNLKKYAEDEFTFETLRWSGNNLESERVQAAKKLEERIAALEKERRKYVVVAHSHGGNVAWMGLERRSHENVLFRRNQLDGLLCWVTVGTPFLCRDPAQELDGRITYSDVVRSMKTEPNPASLIESIVGVVLFPALLVLGLVFRFAFALLIPLSVLYTIAMSAYFLFFYTGTELTVGEMTTIAIAPLGILALLGTMRGLIFLLSLNRYKSYLQKKWVGLTHPDDEAVALLLSAGKVQISLVSQDGIARQLVSILRFFAILLGANVVLLFTGGVLFAQDFMQEINFESALTVLVGAVLVSFCALVFLGLCYMLFVKWESGAVQVVKRLNAALDKMAVRAAYGDDLYGGRMVVSASPYSLNRKERFPCQELPDEVKNSISDAVLRSKTDLSEHVRAWLVRTSSPDISVLKPIELLEGTSVENTSGLIHNSYFESERFMNYLCEQILAKCQKSK
ncbi:MAG: hypothetical protein H6994_03855 [Pseudomonadales bacterium]|nr:hypothetical protein [Pseudomonadales bacterium]